VKGCRRKTLIIDRGSTITSPFKTDTLDYESSRKIKVESIRRTEYDLHKFTLWLLADKKVAEIGQIGPDDIAKA